MLDRLVYVLFFIFVGSGLFLVYQGLKGMGYLETVPALVMQNKQPEVEIRPVGKKQPVVKKEVPVDGDELMAVAFMVRYLPDEESAHACKYLDDHYSRFRFTPGQFNINKLFEELLPLIEIYSQYKETRECNMRVIDRTLSLIEEAKGFDWATTRVASFLLIVIEHLKPLAKHAAIVDLYDQVKVVFQRKPAEYAKAGSELEQEFCHSLKIMGRKKECLHLYPVFNSPNMQLYTLAVRKEYDGEWSRLKVYSERMRKYTEVGEWTGYGEFLLGLHRYHYKKNYRSALEAFDRAIVKREEVFQDIPDPKYHLYFLRSLRQQERLKDVDENLQRFLDKLKVQNKVSYSGMLFVLQKMRTRLQIGEPADIESLRKLLQMFSPDDDFAKEVAKAFEAMVKKDTTYRAPFDNFELKEIEEFLAKR